MLHRRRRRRSGFVLLMVLLVVAIAGTLMAGAARRCAARSLQAGSRVEQLQLRWGRRSCRDLCLSRAEQLLMQDEAAKREAVVSAHRAVELGGMKFDIVVADEQAKANVNVLTQKKGLVGMTASVRRLQSRQRKALLVLPRPVMNLPSGLTRVPMLYGSYDQLFRFERPAELTDFEAPASSALNYVTCWGGGRVNFRRAGNKVLREVLAGSLDETQLKKLIELRKDTPDVTMGEALRHLELNRRKIEQLRKELTERSRCYSLWVVAQGSSRSWHRLYVNQAGDAENDPQQWTFSW